MEGSGAKASEGSGGKDCTATDGTGMSKLQRRLAAVSRQRRRVERTCRGGSGHLWAGAGRRGTARKGHDGETCGMSCPSLETIQKDCAATAVERHVPRTAPTGLDGETWSYCSAGKPVALWNNCSNAFPVAGGSLERVQKDYGHSWRWNEEAAVGVNLETVQKDCAATAGAGKQRHVKRSAEVRSVYAGAPGRRGTTPKDWTARAGSRSKLAVERSSRQGRGTVE